MVWVIYLHHGFMCNQAIKWKHTVNTLQNVEMEMNLHKYFLPYKSR